MSRKNANHQLNAEWILHIGSRFRIKSHILMHRSLKAQKCKEPAARINSIVRVGPISNNESF